MGIFTPSDTTPSLPGFPCRDSPETMLDYAQFVMVIPQRYYFLLLVVTCRLVIPCACCSLLPAVACFLLLLLALSAQSHRLARAPHHSRDRAAAAAASGPQPHSSAGGAWAGAMKIEEARHSPHPDNRYNICKADSYLRIT